MEISTFANLVNALAVTAGVIFAATQIRDYRCQRRRDSMLALVRSFQSSTFAKALRSVIELPDNANAEKIRETLGPDGEDLVAHLTATWETVGVLLFHKELSIDIIDDFFSGPILISWRKLLPYIADLRQQYQRETWSEWFRWLAERMMKREKSSAPVPAHVAHRAWRA
ncbi:MAG: hypothetical protein DME49_08740 [Verrucomicrobia bacterium]|nr:MAG: hypothetical protein DME49_08740 [Verrucomicrobiota bacterium]PYK92624.1 MAG: hypothetical protein DME36_12610 [Verrucomicrobiota bacterium]PYL39204.1 MAG: hypothetical protein DMF34_04700 [Verrucomicrobiota bacterium]